METIVSPFVIGLDGRSGSGKTSLADLLAQQFAEHQVAVLHLEDLYQGWGSLAETCRRYSRLLGEIRAGNTVRWLAWDWDNNCLSDTEHSFTPQQVVLIEGVGTLNEQARDHVDLGIWLEAPEEHRKQRALQRDGAGYAPFWQLWADQEQEYLATHRPQDNAKITLDNEQQQQPAVLAQLAQLARFLPAATHEHLPAAWSTAQAVEVAQLPVPTDVASLFEVLAAGCQYSALLESTSHGSIDPLGRNRYSVIALAQDAHTPRLLADSAGTRVRAGTSSLRLGEGFFTSLAKIWPSARHCDGTGEQGHTLDPQWVGYLGYELKHEVGASHKQAVLPDGTVRPDAQFFEPDTLLVIDHLQATMSLRTKAAFLASTSSRIKAQLSRVRVPQELSAPDFSCRDTSDSYQAKVLEAKEQIRQGNSYEVCLTTELHTTVGHFSPFEAYCRLRQSSPAPFAHYLRLGSLEVSSSSPERFMSISPTGALRAEPIKGTRPRGASPAQDEALRQDLATHPKDRAENIMIVDLLRNDLSHYATPGSLRVPRLCAVESYATVHQMVSTIDAQLAAPQLGAAALGAAFPPGSMTGAPKLSTMQILDQLEAGRARGLYSGAVGYLGATGSADFAVVIRTLVADRLADGSWQLCLGLGGAITADSDPQEEWDEVRTKSVGVLSALGSDFPDTVPLGQ